MVNLELLPKNDERNSRNPGEPPLRGKEEGDDHKKENRLKVLVQQDWLTTLNARHIISCCKKVASEISARHDIVINTLLNNILKQRGLTTQEQKWEDRKMVRTSQDEITIGTEYLRSEEWKKRSGRWSEAEA